jgi:hypothetical protein
MKASLADESLTHHHPYFEAAMRSALPAEFFTFKSPLSDFPKLSRVR